MANLLPPTLAILALGLAQTCVLALLERAGAAARLGRRAADIVRLTNALLLTIYLWQVLAIVVGAGVLVGLSLLLPALAPVLMNQLVLIVVVLGLLALAVPGIARLDARCIPRRGPGPAPRGLAEAGYALFTAGTWAVWQFGAVLHPADPAAVAAVALFVLGVVLLRRATTA